METQPAEAAPRVTDTGPSGRAIIGWGLASLALLGVGLAGVAIWSDARRTCEVVERRSEHGAGNLAPLEAIEELGGPSRAASRLRLYLHLPQQWAPRKSWAARALALVRDEPAASQARSALAGVLGSDDPWLGATALGALGDLGPRPEHLDRICGLLESRDEAMRSSAVRAIGRMRPRPARAPEGLLRAVRDPNHEVRSRAAVAALGGWPADEDVAAAVNGLLADPAMLPETNWWDDCQLFAVVRALQEAGPACRWAEPALRRLAAEADWDEPDRTDLAHQALKAVWMATGELDWSDPRVRDWLMPSDGTEHFTAFERYGLAPREYDRVLEAMRAAEQPGTDAAGTARPRIIRLRDWPASAPAWHAEMEYRLDRRVSFEAVHTPLGELLAEIERLGGVRISTVEAAGLQTPVTLKFTDVPLSMAIGWTTAISHTYFEIREDGIHVGGAP